MGEIDAANLLQEEIIRTEPQLASANSFMNIVSGGKPTNVKGSVVIAERSPHTAIESAGAVVGVDAAAKATTEKPSETSLRNAKFAERQRLTRITAAKSLLKEELRKKNPSIASIATFRRQAYGEGGHEGGVDEAEAAAIGVGCDVGVNPRVVPLCPTTSNEAAIMPFEAVQCVEVEVEKHGQDAMMILEEEVMSIGDSEEEEDESDGFSTSGHSTSGGESARSRGSRKRPADESPERDTSVTARRGFPGVVTRSEAGCRVHLPSAVSVPLDEKDTTIALNAPVTFTTKNTTIALNAPVTFTTKETTIKSKMPLLSTMSEATVALNTTTRPTDVETKTTVGVPTRVVAVEVATESGIAVVMTRMDVGPTTNTSSGTAMRGNAVSPVFEMTVAMNVILSDAPREIISAPEVLVNADIAVDLGVMMSTVVEQETAPSSVIRDVQMVVNPSGVLSTTTVTTRNEIVVQWFPPLLAVEGWGRDALVVEGLFRIIENMERPWVTLNVLEAAVLQFPTADRETLRRSIMTIMMSQRRCVVRLTRAGLRLGPRTDREGNAFIELDLDYADRYNTSH